MSNLAKAIEAKLTGKKNHQSRPPLQKSAGGYVPWLSSGAQSWRSMQDMALEVTSEEQQGWEFVDSQDNAISQDSEGLDTSEGLSATRSNPEDEIREGNENANTMVAAHTDVANEVFAPGAAMRKSGQPLGPFLDRLNASYGTPSKPKKNVPGHPEFPATEPTFQRSRKHGLEISPEDNERPTTRLRTRQTTSTPGQQTRGSGSDEPVKPSVPKAPAASEQPETTPAPRETTAAQGAQNPSRRDYNRLGSSPWSKLVDPGLTLTPEELVIYFPNILKTTNGTVHILLSRPSWRVGDIARAIDLGRGINREQPTRSTINRWINAALRESFNNKTETITTFRENRAAGMNTPTYQYHADGSDPFLVDVAEGVSDWPQRRAAGPFTKVLKKALKEPNCRWKLSDAHAHTS